MAKKRKKRREPLEPLEAIKRLLILSLARQGARSDEVAKVLEVDSSTVRGFGLHPVPKTPS